MVLARLLHSTSSSSRPTRLPRARQSSATLTNAQNAVLQASPESPSGVKMSVRLITRFSPTSRSVILDGVPRSPSEYSARASRWMVQ